MTSAQPVPEQTTSGTSDENLPRHIAIIMDGNGRWAKQRGRNRSKGHEAGVDALRRTVEAIGDLGIEHLTVYAFSTENWSRPQQEVNFLMTLVKLYVTRDVARLHKAGVKIQMIGRRDDLDDDILKLIEDAESKTRDNSNLILNIAFNYGGRQEILFAAKTIAEKAANGELDPESLTEAVFSGYVYTAGLPDPDLIIRTSGENRLSNFLLWQSAYSELLFVDALWPDFEKSDLDNAIAEYQSRNRRFGAV